MSAIENLVELPVTRGRPRSRLFILAQPEGGARPANDNRGQLLWIERAKGVMDAKAMYEEESGKTLPQRELVRRLTEDGY